MSEQESSGSGRNPVRGTQRRSLEAPWQLALAGLIWLAFGIFELFLAATLGADEGVSGQTTQQVTGQVSDDTVSSAAGGSAATTVALVVGILMIGAVLTLAARQGWARYLLVLLGLAAVLSLAVAGQWQAVVAIGLLVIGTLPLMSLTLHRYLAGRGP